MAQPRVSLLLTAVDRVTGVVDKVTRSLSTLNTKLRRTDRAFKIFSKRLDKSMGYMKRFGSFARNIGRSMTTFITLPIVAAGAAALNEFRKFEKGLIGVSKTTDFVVGPQLDAFGQKIIDMSKKMPIAATELLSYAEATGQMGVTGEENILAYTETLAKLQTATKLTGEEGAAAIARILNVTGDFDKKGGVRAIKEFGDSITFLGNTVAANEAEIVGVATRIAGNVSRFKISSNEVLALSAALKALGKESELAGSVTGKIFGSIEQAVLKGGDKLKVIQTLTNKMSRQELKFKLENKPIELLRTIFEGLQKVQKSKGGNFIEVLKNIDLEGVRVNDILGTMITKFDFIEQKLDEIKSGKQIGALDQEFTKFLDSLDARLGISLNKLKSLAIKMGKYLEPVLTKILKIADSVFGFLEKNPALTEFAMIMAGILAIIGPILIIFGGFLMVIPAIMAALPALGLTFGGVALAILAIPIAIGLVIYSIFMLIKHWDKVKQVASDTWDWIAEKALMQKRIWIDPMIQSLEWIVDLFKQVSFSIPTFGSPGVNDKNSSRGPSSDTGFGSSYLGSSLKPPSVSKDSNINVKQNAELSIKLDGNVGSAKVTKQVGFDKININRGLQMSGAM